MLNIIRLIVVLFGALAIHVNSFAADAQPLIVAHRGLLRHAPENTLANFRACLELRIGFEFDVERTKDNHLVCMHDNTVDRTTNGTGKVSELTSEAGADSVNGVLTGDGDSLWIYWPAGRPKYQWEDWGDFAKTYEKHRLTSYKTKSTPLGKHSIGHEIMSLGGGMFMPVLDPSTFHGYTDDLTSNLHRSRARESGCLIFAANTYGCSSGVLDDRRVTRR